MAKRLTVIIVDRNCCDISCDTHIGVVHSFSELAYESFIHLKHSITYIIMVITIVVMLLTDVGSAGKVIVRVAPS